MMWLLSTRIGRAVAGAGALLLAVLTFGAFKERKGRKEAVDEVRRRADASAEKRREERDEIEEDMRQLGDGDAAAELHDKRTRPE